MVHATLPFCQNPAFAGKGSPKKKTPLAEKICTSLAVSKEFGHSHVMSINRLARKAVRQLVKEEKLEEAVAILEPYFSSWGKGMSSYGYKKKIALLVAETQQYLASCGSICILKGVNPDLYRKILASPAFKLFVPPTMPFSKPSKTSVPRPETPEERIQKGREMLKSDAQEPKENWPKKPAELIQDANEIMKTEKPRTRSAFKSAHGALYQQLCKFDLLDKTDLPPPLIDNNPVSSGAASRLAKELSGVEPMAGNAEEQQIPAAAAKKTPWADDGYGPNFQPEKINICVGFDGKLLNLRNPSNNEPIYSLFETPEMAIPFELPPFNRGPKR